MPDSWKSWTVEEDAQLKMLLSDKLPRVVIAKRLQRTIASVESRINIIRKREKLSDAGETTA